MKPLFFLPFGLSIVVFALFGCKKDALYNAGPENSYILIKPLQQEKDIQSDQANLISLGNVPAADCAYPSCASLIEAVRKEYQPLANALCDTVWVDITCCQDGEPAFALVYVAPNDPGCFPCTVSLSKP